MNTPVSASWQGKMLGRYLMMHILGRGGMGEVWLAEDTQLRRQIAIKVLPVTFARDQEYLQAFAREARVAATLDHPHLLPIHDFGQQPLEHDQIVTYLVMPYLADGSLRDRLRAANGPLSPTEALSYLKQAAQAIDYVHSRRILHRDVKPANLLLHQGWLFLADLGIARLLDSTTRHTQHGAGTPGFMAPEQVRGQAEPASDRYSLAATAYVLLTGQQPFTGETPYSILLKQLQENPIPPREHNPALSLITQQVLLWGLAMRPQDRPPSCLAFVQALEQSYQPRVASSPEGDAEKTVLAPWRQYQQGASSEPPFFSSPLSAPSEPLPMPPIPVASEEKATLAPIGQEPLTDPRSTSPAPVPSLPATPSSSSLEQPRTRRSLLIGAGVSLVTLAGLALGGYEWYHHRQPAPQAPVRLPPGPRNLMSGKPVLALTGHSSAVVSVAWDPTGRYLASAGDDTYLMLWDIGNLLPQSSSSVKSVAAPLRKWKIANPTNGPFLFTQDWLCWSADGQKLCVIIQDNKIRLYDALSSATSPHIYQNAAANAVSPSAYVNLAWSLRTNSFATYDINDEFASSTTIHVDLWNTAQPNHPVQTLLFTDKPASLHGSGGIDVLAWSADGQSLAGHTDYGAVIIWDTPTGKVDEVLTLPTRSGPSIINNECLTWSPTDPHLLVASDFDLATVWDVQQRRQVLTLTLNEPGFTPSYVWGMSWAPNGRYLAMCYPHSPRVSIWDMRIPGTSANGAVRRQQQLSFPAPHTYGHTKSVIDVAWSPDGRYIASAGADDLVIVWQVDAG